MFSLCSFFVKVKFCISLRVYVSLLCVCVQLPGKAIPEMIYTVSGKMLNPTRSLMSVDIVLWTT